MNKRHQNLFLKIRILIVIIFLNSGKLFGQHFPFITDNGSMMGSVLAITQYNAIKNTETDLTKQIHGFTTNYSKRLIYLNKVTTTMVSNTISSEFNSTKNRYNTLASKSKSMTFFSYSKKKTISKALLIIETLLTNIEKNLRNQYDANVKNGEKINLFVDVMGELHEVNEHMDVIEDQISNISLLSHIIQTK
jgi:hypothetical protein